MVGTTAGQSQANSSRLDENEFFRHLRVNRHNAELLKLMRSLDKKACIQMAKYVRFYLTTAEEERSMAAERKRGKMIQHALTAAIISLRKAGARYRAAAAIQTINGPLVSGGEPIWPKELPFLGEILEREADRLDRLRKKCGPLANIERFGLFGNISWLVSLEEFVAVWTKRELGEERRLQANQIAALIDAGKKNLGWNTKMSPTNTQSIGRSLRDFRSNLRNQVFHVVATHFRLR
jgi:hypothetical protein